MDDLIVGAYFDNVGDEGATLYWVGRGGWSQDIDKAYKYPDENKAKRSSPMKRYPQAQFATKEQWRSKTCKSTSTPVRNMKDLSLRFYTTEPRKAVIAAYAQSRNDWNTWEYEQVYGHLVEEGEHHYFCKDFAAKK